MSNRIVKIYTTTGIKGLEINTNAKNYGELKPQLYQNGIAIENADVVVAGSNISLIVDSAIIPSEDFILYINPHAKIKSGKISRNEIYAFIKANPEVKDNFRKYGRNYTQVPTVDLQELYYKIFKEIDVKKEVPTCEKPETPPISESVVNISKNNNILEIIQRLDILSEEIANSGEYVSETQRCNFCIEIETIKRLLSKEGGTVFVEDERHLSEMNKIFGEDYSA